MSERESEFLKELKLSLMKYLLGFVITILVTGMTFYFTTRNRLDNLESEQQRLETSKADKDLINTELKNINSNLTEIKDQLKNKQDKCN